MKRILICLVIILSSQYSIAQQKKITDKERMSNYDILYRMFDCPFNESEISRWLYGKDINSYYELLKDNPEYKDYPFQSDDDKNSIFVMLPDTFSLGEGMPHPAAMRISSDENTIIVRYIFPTELLDEDDVAMKILSRMMNNNDPMIIYDEDSNSYTGPYDHIYNLWKEDGSTYISCTMPKEPQRWYSIPAGYNKGLGYSTLPNYAPCNRGKEPFNKFIKKFNSDSKFRSERVYWSNTSLQHDYKQNGIGMYGFYKIVIECLDKTKLLPLKGHKKSRRIDDEDPYDDVYDFGIWYYPSENRVIYNGWIDTDKESNSDGIVILFERIDGEWYCTLNQYWGSNFNNEIMKYISKLSDQ